MDSKNILRGTLATFLFVGMSYFANGQSNVQNSQESPKITEKSIVQMVDIVEQRKELGGLYDLFSGMTEYGTPHKGCYYANGQTYHFDVVHKPKKFMQKEHINVVYEYDKGGEIIRKSVKITPKDKIKPEWTQFAYRDEDGKAIAYTPRF